MAATEMKFESWLKANLPRFRNLTASVVSIVTSLLSEASITFLSVTGRTKDEESCIEKVKRKGYKKPQEQMTDISGIRIILFFQHDIQLVTEIITKSFRVDQRNSMNRDKLMSVNEVGYRSVHFVCDLGKDRVILPEFAALENFKFEFQIRTVLQHAWAELAHDRSYKLSAKLPAHLERKLFLLAGMLETADSGFSDLSIRIDDYVRVVSSYDAAEFLQLELDSITLCEFVKRWGSAKGLRLSETENEDHADLLAELQQFGISSIGQLNAIIPREYKKHVVNDDNSIQGCVRDWMMISNIDRFLHHVEIKWVVTSDDLGALEHYLSESEIDRLMSKHGGGENIYEFPP